MEPDATEPWVFLGGGVTVCGASCCGGGNADAEVSLPPCRRVFIFRPQKNLGMDAERVRQPAGPPSRKKFHIPLDEDEVPPPGVGQGDGGNHREAGGFVGKGPCGLESVGAWVALGEHSFPLCRSVSLSVHVMVVLREDQGRGHKLATSECLLCSQHPGFARHEFIANTLELEGFAN